MSLYPRGQIWWCRWIIDGQQVCESTSTSDKKQAQEYHDRRRAELWRETKLNEAPAVRWNAAALDWATEHAQHKKSYETDRYRLLWLTDKLTTEPLVNINTERMVALRSELIEDDREPSTANRFLAIVSAVLNYAHEKGHIPGVPKIPYLPEANGRIKFLTKPQARKLIAELPKHLAPLARFTLATGLRRANATHLTWDSVDMGRRVAWVWADEAKADKPLAVPLNDDAMAVLESQKGINARYVFVYRKQPLQHTTTKAWYLACARAGIDDDFTWHGLRHTWASWHVMSGTPLEVLQKLGGWADLKMVMRYAHLAPGYVAEYASNVLLDRTLSGTVESDVSEDSIAELGSLGWPTGLEPATTGITIATVKKKAA